MAWRYDAPDWSTQMHIVKQTGRDRLMAAVDALAAVEMSYLAGVATYRQLRAAYDDVAAERDALQLAHLRIVRVA